MGILHLKATPISFSVKLIAAYKFGECSARSEIPILVALYLQKLLKVHT